MNTLTKARRLKELYESFETCNDFPVDTTGATNIVLGEGDANAKLMIIGEAPGKQEDEAKRPFVGRSGQLLTKTLNQVGLSRNKVFITNVAKCRPPNNRKPKPQEIAAYKKMILEKEIEIICPTVILTLGSVALKAILENNAKITAIRGTQQLKGKHIIVPTYHPAYILRNPSKLNNFVQDIQFATSFIKKEK